MPAHVWWHSVCTSLELDTNMGQSTKEFKKRGQLYNSLSLILLWVKVQEDLKMTFL